MMDSTWATIGGGARGETTGGGSLFRTTLATRYDITIESGDAAQETYGGDVRGDTTGGGSSFCTISATL